VRKWDSHPDVVAKGLKERDSRQGSAADAPDGRMWSSEFYCRRPDSALGRLSGIVIKAQTKWIGHQGVTADAWASLDPKTSMWGEEVSGAKDAHSSIKQSSQISVKKPEENNTFVALIWNQTLEQLLLQQQFLITILIHFIAHLQAISRYTMSTQRQPSVGRNASEDYRDPPASEGSSSSGTAPKVDTPSAIHTALPPQAAPPLPSPQPPMPKVATGSKMMATTLYTPMPAPGAVGAPFFTEANVGDFFEVWELLYDNHGLTKDHMLQHLMLYCAELIGEYVKALPKYIKGSFSEIKEKLIKNYKRYDVKQKYYFWIYLEEYKWKAADNKKELKNYVLQFWIIFSQLMIKGKLDQYMSCLWFMERLPETRLCKIKRKIDIKSSEPETYNLDKVRDATMELGEEEECLSEFRTKPKVVVEVKTLVNKHRGDPIAAQKDAQLPTIRTVRTGNDVDTLTKAFSGLTSPLQLRVEQFEMALQASQYPGQPPYNSWYQNPEPYPSTSTVYHRGGC